MKIEYIELNNIRSHKNTRVEFPEGSTLLWGDIGAGKSTILYSIDYALFGASSDIKGENILRKGTSKGRIKVCFEINNKKVIVERNIEKVGNSIRDIDCFLSINGLREKLSPKMLKSKIFKILRYPTTLKSLKKIIPFRYTVYVPQERMKEILSGDAQERLKILRSFFNIEKYQRIIENAKELRSFLKEKMIENEGKISILEENLHHEKEYKEGLKEIENNLMKLTHKIFRLEEELKVLKILREKEIKLEKERREKELKIKDIENEIIIKEKEIEHKKENIFTLVESSSYSKKYKESIISKNISLLNEIEEKIRTLKNNLLSNKEKLLYEKGKIEEMKKSIEEKIKEFRTLKENKSKIEGEVNEKENNLTSLKKEISSLKEKIEEIDEKRINEIVNKEKYIQKIENLKKERSIKEEEIKHIIQEISKLKTLIENKNKEISKIKSHDICPFCSQKITEKHKEKIEKEFIEYKNKIDLALKDLKNRYNLLIGGKEEIEKNIERYENMLREINEVEKKYEKNNILKKEIEKREEKMQKLKEEIENKRKILEEISQKENTYKGIDEEYKRINEKSTIISEKLKEIEFEIQQETKEEIIFTKAKTYIKKFFNEEKEFQEIKENIKLKIKKNKETLAEIIKELENIQKEVKEKEKYEEEYKKISDQYNLLKGKKEEIEKKLKEIQTYKKEIKENKEIVTKIKQLIEFIEIHFIPMVSSIEKQVFNKIKIEFEKSLREWINFILPNAEFMVYLDETFYPKIYLDEYEISYTHLSGGEKQSIALAYRLALNKIMNDIIGNKTTQDLLILDEPTDGFSVEQMESIRNILNYLRLKQLIIVSHERIMKDFVDHIIYVEKRNGISSVKSE